MPVFEWVYVWPKELKESKTVIIPKPGKPSLVIVMGNLWVFGPADLTNE